MDHAAAGPKLSCAAPQRMKDLFPPEDLTWRASDVVEAIEQVRKKLRVPFFVYGKETGLPTLEEDLAAAERCMANLSAVPRVAQKYAPGELWFFRSLVAHPWRTENADLAAILIVPG